MTGLSDAQAARLKAIAAGQEVLSGGAVRLVGISGLQAHYKDTWDAVKEEVFRHAQIAVESVVSGADIVVRVGDHGFLLIFADPDPTRAEDAAGAASDAILHRLFGADANLASMVDTAVRTFTIDKSNLPSLIADTSEPLKSGHGWSKDSGEAKAFHGAGLADRPDHRDLPDAAPPAIRFHPVWNTAKSVVMDFVAKPQLDRRAALWGPMFGAAETPTERQDALALDLRTLAAVEDELRRLALSESRMLVTACICASSFSSMKLSSQITGAIGKIPKSLRRCLQCVIYETRIGAGAADVDMAARSLAPLCRSTSLATVVKERRFLQARSIGLKAIGVDLSPYGHVPEPAIMARLKTLLESAHSAGLRAFVYGLNSRSLASFAACSGAENLCGDVIGPATSTIPAAIRFEPHHLYDSLAAPAGAAAEARRSTTGSPGKARRRRPSSAKGG
ncbi:MAG: hypothetical protein H6843_07495 [Rhodospirillaceae bacterium]|nr:hypothetical protein [Rhodospirillaceae bacterium]